MFQQLRLTMALSNAAIILALFLFLILSTYLSAKRDLNTHREAAAQSIVTAIQSGILRDFPPPSSGPQLQSRSQADYSPKILGLIPARTQPSLNFFFVKTSPTGIITFQSANQPLAADSLAAITHLVFETPATQGTFTKAGITYYYYKAPLTAQPDTVIVLHDLTPESDWLQSLVITLLAAGLICTLLSFAASFYMANRAILPIKRAWQQQHDFLSNVSHELRTPLTVINTNLDIVKESLDETVASQIKWLDNIQEESSCMKNLVNSLLFLARADSNQLGHNKNLFPVDITISEAVAPFEAIAKQKNLILEESTMPSIECFGDKTQLKQVLAILLDNACRHTDPGGKITVTLSKLANKMQLTVSDTGEGIEPQHLEKIFDRFYQVDEARNKGGSGLGLSIAKWIVESHGGSITANSTPGTGTLFTILLPIRLNT